MTSQRTEDEPRRTLQIQCDKCRASPLRVYFRCQICNSGHFYICQKCWINGAYCDNDEHELREPGEVLVDVEPSKETIKRYVQAALEIELNLGGSDPSDNRVSTYGTTPLGRLMRSQPSLKDEILTSVVDNADDTYVLAGLYLNSLTSLGLSEAEILEMLEYPPEGYFQLYEQHMKRIQAAGVGDEFGHSSSLGTRVLSWVACTKRPLSLSELQDALAIDLKKPEFDPAARYDKATIVAVTAGLITIDNDGKTGNEAVRLNHRTAQKYFDQTRERWFPNVQAEITKVALHYLSLNQLSKPCENEWEDKQFQMRKVDYPFLEYAYQYWGDHAAEAGSDAAAQSAIMTFVSDSDKIAASIQAMWHLKSDATLDWDVRKGANGLHVCAYFGLTNAISKLLAQGLDADSRDFKYAQTPLMYACRRGHTTSVMTLLNRGADVNMHSNRESCAMFEAVCANKPEVVKVLLAWTKTNINVIDRSRSGISPLILAAQEGYIDIARSFLHHEDIDLNSRDLNGNTALFHAIQAEHTEIAQDILDRQDRPNKWLDLNSRNWKGTTALILAASKGQEDIVNQLLSKGADPSIKDKEGGGTAILRAVDEGQILIVQIMLNFDVDLGCVDDQDRGLLHGAAISGHEKIVRLLLDGRLDPNTRDKKGRTPLHDASRNGHSHTTQILLDRGADTSLQDESGRTPWTLAWQHGHQEVMRVLERRDPYEITEQDLSGIYPNASVLPVWSLALLGEKEQVAQAIGTRKNEIAFLDPDSSNTSLHCAVIANQPEIAQLLLDAGLSVDATNDYFRTPLHMAAIEGNINIMKMLLEDAVVDEKLVNAKDKWGTTPLLMAFSNRHFECSLLLVEAGASIPDTKQSMKQSLFFFAIEFGRLQAVMNLVNMGADVQVKNMLGLTGLQMAQDKGKADIEVYLRKNKSVWVKGADAVNAESMMESMTLNESPFHQPQVWEEVEDVEEVQEQNGVATPNENNASEGSFSATSLQLLEGLKVPLHDPGSGRASDTPKERVVVEPKPVGVPQLF